ncbi:hypothetical protein G8764_04570 [Pseudomaricurvus alcaniphilus]|uniref:hypothetical protein n=1 Tax=Pseudomaricurvus alcaniphilus TaxID=1166482 RepID=UPI001407A6CF|nr:hypothetical protein [Pseudomaricurvus alcaniphilus]NHN36563.1 hypothetical protein [Pseudomaricurvus alcaniphilus]
MQRFELKAAEWKAFTRAFDQAKQWCSENQLAVGLGEMAVGAGLVAWGVQNGAIKMGEELVATELDGSNAESIVGAAGGSGIGAIAGSIVGSIGVAGMGGAIGIPAALVIGGSAAVLGMAGYTIGDVIHNSISSSVEIESLFENGSVLLVGLALIIDGARRCISDPKVLTILSKFKDRAVILNNLCAKVIARSIEELRGYIEELKKLPEDKVQATFGISSAALGATVGASAGGAVAAGSVAVLGSSTLGGVAISMGLIAAPIWPVIAGVAGGAGIGFAAYKAVKYWRAKPESDTSET